MRPSGSVVVLGQGYVGLPLAMRAVEAGYSVVGFDVEAGRVKRLLAGESYVEDVPSDSLAAALATGRYTASTDPKALAGFDVAIVDRTVPGSSPKEAERTKLLENTFRHVNVALVNELAMFANDLGIDVWEAIDAASTKPFGYLRFTPGPGVGGHCLPIDPSYLSWRVRRTLGHSFRFVE